MYFLVGSVLFKCMGVCVCKYTFALCEQFDSYHKYIYFRYKFSLFSQLSLFTHTSLSSRTKTMVANQIPFENII